MASKLDRLLFTCGRMPPHLFHAGVKRAGIVRAVDAMVDLFVDRAGAYFTGPAIYEYGARLAAVTLELQRFARESGVSLGFLERPQYRLLPDGGEMVFVAGLAGEMNIAGAAINSAIRIVIEIAHRDLLSHRKRF